MLGSVPCQPVLINGSAFSSLLNFLPHTSFSIHWYELARHSQHVPRWFLSIVTDWDGAHTKRLFDLSASDWIRAYTSHAPMPGS